MDQEYTPEEIDFSQRVHEVILRELEWPFEDVLREYRRIEEEFVARAGDNEEVALDFKRRISMKILGAAHMADQPHDVCRGIWEEIVERGFPDDEVRRRIHMGIYARCCQMNGEFDTGIAVLEEIIAEVQQRLQDTSLSPNMRSYFEHEITMACKVRDELKAGIRE